MTTLHAQKSPVATRAPRRRPAHKRIEARGPVRQAWTRLRRDKIATSALIVIGLLIAFALAAPLVAAFVGHPVDRPYRETGLTPNGLPVGPGAEFLLGTDNLGRDLLVRIAYGARLSLLVGIVTTVLALAVGVVVGLVSGYIGGKVDTSISRFMDVVLGFPFLVTAIALVAVFEPGVVITVAVILFFLWAPVARIVRGQVLSLREREFVAAARSLGASNIRIMFVDLLPNLIGPVVIYGTLLIPQVIVYEATLSFLGLGVPGMPTWGQILSEVQDNSLYEAAWWMLVFPAGMLLITTLAFNVLGDGLRDAIDPGSQRVLDR